MKKFISKYILYIYLNFINDDDIEICKSWTIPFMKKLIFTHNIYIWTASVVFFPIFFIVMQAEEIADKILIKD